MQDDRPEVKDYSVRLLNTYASNIECTRIDCEKNLFIVLLQSGHMDIWYKSQKIFGSIFHQYHQISNFLDYDYQPINNTFYFTTNEDIVQLKIIALNEAEIEAECVTKEIRKSISGMIACTWVESKQQLVCLSFNNIFYRICFNFEETTENETNYENLSHLYALNAKRVEELMAKAAVMSELIERPKRLHEAIEKEFEKQQLLALGSKHDILKKLFYCHIEWHVYLPSTNYFEEDCIQIRTLHSPNQTQSIICLIFVTLKNTDKTFLNTLFNTSAWYLHISNRYQSILINIPNELINKKLCFVLESPLKNGEVKGLAQFSLNLLTFLNHNANFMCLKFNLILECNEKTYRHLFSSNFRNIVLPRKHVNDIENLIANFNKNKTSQVDRCRNNFELKHQFTISEKELKDIMLQYFSKSSFDKYFKLYYIYQYLIELSYDVSKHILQISSNNPEAILYFKLFLLHTVHSRNLSNISDHMLAKSMVNYNY